MSLLQQRRWLSPPKWNCQHYQDLVMCDIEKYKHGGLIDLQVPSLTELAAAYLYIHFTDFIIKSPQNLVLNFYNQTCPRIAWSELH